MLAAAKLLVLSFLGIILLEEATSLHAAVRRYRFELKNTPYTRVCTSKTILTINGQFPGPTIYARRGDLVIVDVINHANHNITIHWHGVKMPRNPWSDGPAYVTQCPITPGKRFKQRIILSDEEGTLWWHAHSGWTRNTVHGAIIILPPKNEVYPFPNPHAEFPIILEEWWNADLQEVYEEFVRSGDDPKASDAFLINGLPGNLYPCSTQLDIYKLIVEFGKTYLIRMINAVMGNFMYFRIANHNITVVGTDGAYTKPFTTDYIAISPGQTIDFLLEANQPPNRYYMASRILTGSEGLVETPTTGYVEYIGEWNYAPPTSPPLPHLPPVNSTLEVENFNRKLKSLARIDVPKNVTENLFYTLSMNLVPCTNPNCSGPHGRRLRTSINNVSFVLPKVSLLEAYYYHINGVYETNFPDHPPFPYNYTQYFPSMNPLMVPQKGTKVKILEYNSTVELMFQGTSQAGGLQHSLHLHGHGVYVVGAGFGNFDRSTDPANYNLVDPPLMQIVAIPRNGWVAIRFRANNPGVWLLHCHYERHLSWGMAMVFIVKDGEHPNEKMLPPPPDMPFCVDPSTLSTVNPAESRVEVDAV